MSFIRQGSWMALCNTGAGLLMFGVHLLAPAMMGQAGEYGLFVSLLGILHLTMCPAPGLQTVMAHQAAAARNPEQEAHVAMRARGVLLTALGAWLLVLLLGMLKRDALLAHFKLDRYLPLGVILVAGLLQLWLPVLMGMLQGYQRFVPLGWSLLVNGGGRLFLAAGFILLLGGSADAAAMGVLGGILLSLMVAAFSTRDKWHVKVPIHSMSWYAWAWDMLPMILAPILFQLMLVADMLFFRSISSAEESSFYGLAGTIGRGMVMFLGPLVGVMFPKLVEEHAAGKTSHLVFSTIKLTLCMGGLICVFMTALPACLPALLAGLESLTFSGSLGVWVGRLLDQAEGIGLMVSLLPWFSWGMLCLCCSQIFLSQLLSHKRYKALKLPMVVVMAYLICLGWLPDNIHQLVRLILIFNVILLLVLMVQAMRDKSGLSNS